MKYRRFNSLIVAGLCLAVSVAAGWVWHLLSDAKYEAHARLALAADPFADAHETAGNQPAALAGEATLLAPEVLSAAAALLQDRGVALGLASPFDSEIDYLVDRIRVARPARGDVDAIDVVCSAANPQEALQILTALVDAYLAAALTVPPAAAESSSDEPEAERRQLARAIERQERTIAALVEQLRAAKLAAAEQPGADPADAEFARAAARRAVVDAQKRLDDARHDVDQNLSAEVVATRLADGPSRTKLLERLTVSKRRDELDQQEAQLQKWSSVYGRNHPRMTEIRANIDRLQQQVPKAERGGRDVALVADNPAPHALVLDALESELADSRVAEEALESRQSLEHERLNGQNEFESQLAEARQELAFLHGEHDRLRRQIDRAFTERTSRVPALLDPPALSPEPIAPHAGFQMAVSSVAGMPFCLVLLWRARSRRLRRPSPPQAPVDHRPFARQPALAPALIQVPQALAPAPRRERFRSQEEQRLARLKMLSVRG